jgi:hypothetical protein
MKLLLPAALLLLASYKLRSEQQQHYDQAQAAALKQLTFLYTVSGLRFGMGSSQVQQHLDSLRQHDELGWQLSSGQLPMQVEPEYVKGRLVRLQVLLHGSGLTNSLEHLELLKSLDNIYGEGYEHSPGDEGGVRSWFKGGTEVQLMTLSGTGYALDYRDLPQVHALTRQHLRQDSLEIVQMEQHKL